MSSTEFMQFKSAFIADVFGDIVLSVQYDGNADSVLFESEVVFEASPKLPSRASMGQEDQASLQLEELINSAKQTPTLGMYIREKAHRSELITYRPALFEQGQISRDYWSKLLNDEIKASKEKLLRVAILLQLSIEEAEEMLDKAGYTMSMTILRDVVVVYCLSNQYYDFVVIEQLLADYQVQSLFNDRRVFPL